MAKKQDINMNELLQKFEELEVSPKVKFVVNPIIYADGEESDVSSDEEYDSSEELQFDELDTGDKLILPYHPFRIIESKANAAIGEKRISTPVGFTKGQKLLQVNPNIVEELGKSTVVQPFLDNLYNTGLESEDDRDIEQLVSASICLNRPLSLSTRKNNLLTKELQTKTEGPITHSKIGIFWKFNWYSANNKIVEYKTVRTFYKKLKRYDADNDTSKAEEFRDICESGIAPPYQELREIAKNHTNTKELVTASRIKNSNADVYLSFVDGDTKSFNGIYSAYVRIYKAAIVKPSVMTTGYEFTKEQEGDYPFVEGSKLDRFIRVATNKYLKCGVYFPEPNFCVAVTSGATTVTESFINKTIKACGVIIKNTESVALMRNLINSRGNETFEVIFSDDNPLLTTIPNRVRLTKSAKTPIKFSDGFVNGLGPTEKDLVSFKQMSQSHVHEGVWIDNFEPEFLKIIANANILALIEDGILNLTEMSDVSNDILEELLYDDEIISLLTEEKITFDELTELYDEFVEDSYEKIGDFNFSKFYELIVFNKDEFTKLLFQLNLGISDIIRFYNDDYDMFCAFANDNAISFFQEYGADIDIEYMARIYHDNPDLFHALINDDEDILGDLGVEDFIERYEQAQHEISQIPNDDPYSGTYDAYDFVRTWVMSQS